MMAAANLPPTVKAKLFKEAFATATVLDSLATVELDGATKSRYEWFYGSAPKFAEKLRTWGEAAVIKVATKRSGKLKDRGRTVMLVGYAANHANDVYRFYDHETERIKTSRDVTWLGRMFFDSSGSPSSTNLEAEEKEELVVDMDEGVGNEESEGNTEKEVEHIDDEVGGEVVEANNLSGSNSNNVITSTRSGRRIIVPERYRNEIGGAAALTMAEIKYYSELYDDKCDQMEVAAVGAGIGGGFVNTSELRTVKYEEAMSNRKEKRHWQGAVLEEKSKWDRLRTVLETKRSELPPGTKVITTTWAMKKKANGKYRARLNARGFEQQDGIHYDSTSTAAPVVSEVTIRVMLTMVVMCDWAARLVDVQGAFLLGEFEEKDEKVYIEVPKGFEEFYAKDSVLLLLKTLYGLKQSALAFWKVLLTVMRKMNFERSTVDPSVYYKWDDCGLALWFSWVDDCVLIGKKGQSRHGGGRN